MTYLSAYVFFYIHELRIYVSKYVDIFWIMLSKILLSGFEN